MARRGDQEGERAAPGEREPPLSDLERRREAARAMGGAAKRAARRGGGPVEPARHTGVRP
jgi:hypothetical protein